MVQITKSLSLMASAACFSTMLFMSSCSKEDAVTPSPEVAVQKSDANMHSVEYLPSIEIPTCNGCSPTNWIVRGTSYGISNSRHLYGNATKPWIKQILAPSTGSGTFITIGKVDGVAGETNASFKNLELGKTYKLTFSVATNSIKNAIGGNSAYAYKVKVYVGPNGQFKDIYVGAKPEKWITESITFTATDDLVSGVEKLWFLVWPSESQPAKTTYANIHLGPNAVELVD